MSKNTEGAVREHGYTQDRDVSWLRFNRRVLEEAADQTVPLLERLKFLSIFTSNLDEFFMVRVGGLFDLAVLSPDSVDNKSGLSPAQRLEQIYGIIPGLIAQKERLYAQLSAQLKKAGIWDLEPDELTAQERKRALQYFKTQVRPILSPQVVDGHHPFPHLNSKQLYIAAHLQGRRGGGSLGLLPMPSALPPFLVLDKEKGRFVRMERLLLQWAPTLFGGEKVASTCVLCVTRNADLSFDQEKFEDDEEDFRNHVTKLLKKRSHLAVVRLELSRKISGEFLKLLKGRILVQDCQIFFDHAPLNMSYVFPLLGQLSRELLERLSYPAYHPRWPEDLRRGESMIEQIQRRDRLLFFPFDQVDPFLELLSEAAERADVVSIKITIYRLASSSKIARTLCRAAENGKEVTVLMELRARFDEANNISWSKLLEDAGCQVIYGVEDFKCHSKICLITLRQGEHLSYITQLGTGNYNEKTNTMYTDFSLMTASEEIGMDGTVFFQNMLVGSLENSCRRLLVAPAGIKSSLLALADREIEKGHEGYICVKANALTEREVIDKLAQASRAGVQVQLIIRGICCLRPGIPGQTENIHVTSIVGRYLEHARIYCFGRGEGAKVFLGSADLMTRNLNRRVEIVCPVEEPEIKDQLLWVLRTQLDDNVKASTLLPDGAYLRETNPAAPVDSQQIFMERSIHRPAAEGPGKQQGTVVRALDTLALCLKRTGWSSRRHGGKRGG